MKRSTTPAFSPDPLWFKDAIIYETHVKCFFDGNNDGIGDFQGLVQKLEYLKGLGITCLWLLPFYPSPLRDDGYDISDYQNVHPSYGTLKDFRHFVREAHRLGLRVITELVINHTSDQHPWFQAARKAPKGSSKRDFYVWSDTDLKYKEARIIFKDTEKSNWTWDPEANAYYWHRFFSHQPDLNFDNPHVFKAVMRVMRFWLDMGVDGLRLDAVPYLVERDGTNCENLPGTHAILKAMRKEMDANYKDRVFLAEANQWPIDVLPYFGNGDECHMAFHFPLMPRIFMALRQEDRHPITEILRQTPAIPDNCQWAIFLRNHDELTLEMVTDEERDYMYAQYATDPLMRLNLGIRRRLAPLVDNSRRRLELLFSLLFSFPGTPVLYYGDEINMGDNYYLGDRNGVRTPMQWSNDRNGGFSRAEFAKLYSPPLMDSGYSYQSTNVEAQTKDPSSLLNWLKHIIEVSKRFKTFGRGTLDFLHPANRKILAYVRRYKDETFLAVANLSRFAQPTELDLSEFSGRIPVELLGSTEFAKIGTTPYPLTLGPHSFFWFQLKRAGVSKQSSPSTPTSLTEETKKTDLRISITKESTQKIFEQPLRNFLEKEVLPSFLLKQRWYGHKSETIQSIRFMDWGALDVAGLYYVAFIEVSTSDKQKAVYNFPLGFAWGIQASERQSLSPEKIIAPAQDAKEQGVLFDATADDEFCRLWMALIDQKKELKLQKGILRGVQSSAYAAVAKQSQPLTVTHLSGEQSNTSIRLGSELILKLYRHVDPGINPDYEVSYYLTEKTAFQRVPPTVGGIFYTLKGQEDMTVTMVQKWVGNKGDGWSYTLDQLQAYYVRAREQSSNVQLNDFKQGLVVSLTAAISPAASSLIGPFLNTVSILAQRTAELHRVLANKDLKDEAFSPKPLTETYLKNLCQSVFTSAAQTFHDLEKKSKELPTSTLAKVEQVLKSRNQLTCTTPPSFKQPVPQGLIRCHGDYHLGQVLWNGDDFSILDFEGEPARTLDQRRERQSPLKDVAGMLRSFHYVAYAALFKSTADHPSDFEKLEPSATFWVNGVSTQFLKTYRETLGNPNCVPADASEFQTLLNLFLLDKALYEVRYELNNRPTWVAIPLEGLLSLVKNPEPPSS